MTRYYIFFVLAMFMMKANRLTFHNYHYAIIGWLGYKFLSLLWTTDYAVFKRLVLTEVGFVALLLCITAYDNSAPILKVLEKTTLYCSALMGVLSLFFSESYHGISTRQVLTLFNMQNDPNNLAAFLLFGFSIALHSLLYTKKHKLLYISIIVINAYTTLLTGSRAGFISILVITTAFLITVYNPKTYKISYLRFFVVAILLVLAGMVAFRFMPTDILERLFTFEDYEDGSNRVSLWRYGLSILSNPINLIMGAGWGAYGDRSLHNTALSVLCDVGIIGFSLLFFPPAIAVLKMLKKKQVLPFAIFLSGMIPSFFIEAINKRFFWNTIIYVLVAYNCYIKERKQTQTDPPTGSINCQKQVQGVRKKCCYFK